ncbi:MAG: 3-dehydroquinate synthase family protein, partial [Wenzhouxiangella sp.]|nr:3-dehydroquinate synthase family protein [Wenzhouxiangella sp.]
LLAQVDAAVGGKTAVNHAEGKNLIGAFHAPEAVIADLDTLLTLDERDYRAGMAEVVKYGAIRDPAFFAWLDGNAEALAARLPDALMEAVYQSVRNKAAVVAADEKESGQRALLNFGHTFGHALETLTGYARYRHGEAVAIGMVLAARLSETLGLCPTGSSDRLEALLQRLGLDTALPEDADPERLLQLMRLDKKNRAEEIRLILLNDIGRACIRPCPTDDIREVLTR